jgi:hypothetical protein
VVVPAGCQGDEHHPEWGEQDPPDGCRCHARLSTHGSGHDRAFLRCAFTPSIVFGQEWWKANLYYGKINSKCQ